MRVLLLVGRSGVGKTTLLQQAVRELSQSGHRVLACKHSHHDLADTEGADSSRLAQAGADAVALFGRQGFHLFGHALSLESLLPMLCGHYDVCLVEGGKSSDYPKVELIADEAPLVEAGAVVGYLSRGSTPDDQKPVRLFLELLWSHGVELSP